MNKDIGTMYRDKKTGTLIKMKLLEINPHYVFITPLYSEYCDLNATELSDYGAIKRTRFDNEYEKVEEEYGEMVWKIDKNHGEGWNQTRLEEFFDKILENCEVDFEYSMSAIRFTTHINNIKFRINYAWYEIKEGDKIIFNPIGRFTISNKDVGILCIIKVEKKECLSLEKEIEEKEEELEGLRRAIRNTACHKTLIIKDEQLHILKDKVKKLERDEASKERRENKKEENVENYRQVLEAAMKIVGGKLRKFVKLENSVRIKASYGNIEDREHFIKEIREEEYILCELLDNFKKEIENER